MMGADSRTARSLFVAIAIALVVVTLAELAARTLEAEIGAGAIWGDEVADVKVGQINSLSTSNGIDVVFLGSSVMNVAADPDAFLAQSSWAGSAYNASLNAASASVLELWATEVVLPELRPDVLVIGLTSRTVNDNSLRLAAAADRYEDSLGRRLHVGEASMAERVEAGLRHYSALIRIRSELRAPVDLVLRIQSGRDLTDALSNAGYDGRLTDAHYAISDEFRTRNSDEVLNDYAVGGAEMTALARLIEAARQSGATVYLLDAPTVEADWADMHPRGSSDVDAYRQALRELGAALDVVVLEPPQTPWSSDYFADPIHLNGRGADRLNRWLVGQINEP